MFYTKTFPNHFSMVTGLYEDEHEIVGNQMYDSKLNDTFRPTTTDPAWWNPNGDRLPIWTANELYTSDGINGSVETSSESRKRYSASMMFPGSNVPFMNRLPTHYRNHSKTRNYTENMDQVIDWITDPIEPANFVAIYCGYPDEMAHIHGPWGEKTLASLRHVDSAAGYLVKRLRDTGLADRTNIIFVSDHGMSELKQTLYLDRYANTTNFNLYGSSPGWSVFVKPEKRYLKNKIYSELKEASKKADLDVWRRAEVPSKYHYSKTARIGDFFIMTRNHSDLFLSKSVDDGSWHDPTKWGNHGWKPDDPDMRPLFMGFGPSFRKDYYNPKIFQIIDLFPLMAFLLDLPLDKLPNNGTLASTVDFIDIGHFNHGNEVGKCEYPLVLTSFMAATVVKCRLISPINQSSNFCCDPSNIAVAETYLILAMMLLIAGMAFIAFSHGKRSRHKAKYVEFEDLAPSLNIDLNYYASERKV